jgi:hypothetical protein
MGGNTQNSGDIKAKTNAACKKCIQKLTERSKKTTK